jgi:trehalose 6-phosphate synthase
VLANREPVRHDRGSDGGITARRSTGGLVTALEPLIEACSGVWVAHGAGSADRIVVDGRDGIGVPPANPQYRLRRVWLDAAEERGYYYGFANSGLWPLCHQAGVQPIFRPDDFSTYRAVNARFADAVCQEVASDCPLVLVQDYHFALAPRMIRARLPLATIVAFWHIPWPGARDVVTCPWAHDLVRGLLDSSIVGFQTAQDCRNFIDVAECLFDARVSRSGDEVRLADHCTVVRPYPVSIEWPSRWVHQLSSIESCRREVRRQLGVPPDIRLVVGVDRLDYTKGITEKLRAVEALLESHPELRERVVLVQIAEPSRECLPAYRDVRDRIRATADRINTRFAAADSRPIILLEAHHDPLDVYRLLRAADVCYVGSLHDGMNLVAKEFVAARDDERGALVLSRFAGSARELTSAIIINPYATAEAARALHEALLMPDEEQGRRMRAMRSVVASRNGYRWAAEMVIDATGVRTEASSTSQRRQRREHDVIVHA